jgi:hypothetical protein
LYDGALVLGNYANWRRTNDNAAFELFHETVLSLHSSQQFQRISYKYGWLAEAWAQKGEIELVRKFAALAFKRALKGDRLGEASAARALALIHADRRGRGAEYYLHLARRAAEKRGSPREAALNDFCEAQIALSTNRRDDAIIAALKAKDGFNRLAMQVHAAQADAFLAANSLVAASIISSH